MNGTGVITAVLTLFTVRAGAFVVSPSSGAVDASCVSRAVGRRSGGIRTSTTLAELHSRQRCRRERKLQQGQDQEQDQRHTVLFSSRRRQHTSQQRQRRPRGRAGFDHLPAESTAIMNMRPSNGEEAEGELQLRRQQPRPPRQQHQPQGRGQQTRAEFLRAGASLAGLTAVVLGAQQQVCACVCALCLHVCNRCVCTAVGVTHPGIMPVPPIYRSTALHFRRAIIQCCVCVICVPNHAVRRMQQKLHRSLPHRNSRKQQSTHLQFFRSILSR